MTKIPHGAYPAMITPFTADGEIDYPAVEALLRWYEGKHCSGVLALCASSETNMMTLEERIKLAGFIAAHKGGLTVVTSGHVSESLEDQIIEMNAMADSGADGLCFIVKELNLLCENNDDDQFIEKLKLLIDGIRNKDIPLGFYEQPGTGNRDLSPKIIKFCASTGRFAFLKETSCEQAAIAEKIAAAAGSDFGIYNANSTLLLESLKVGAAGFCGIMGNFHPDLYQWICVNFEEFPKEAQRAMDYVGALSMAAAQYPASARYHHQHYGASMTMYSRRGNSVIKMNDEHAERIHQMERVAAELREWMKSVK